MKNLLSICLFLIITGCTTMQFRSKNSIPVTFEGNGKHQKEILVEGTRSFYFWGLNPEEHVVYVDEEVRKAGYEGISKVIIFEQKNPQDILISFLTFGLYLPRAFTIMGYTSGTVLSDELEDSAPPTIKSSKK